MSMSMNQTIDRIARDVLNIATLEPRNRDSLDFHDLSVGQIREALEEAYQAGIKFAARERFEQLDPGIFDFRKGEIS